MATAADRAIDYAALASGARVHGSLYRDPDIFARELEAIWHKVWVYIGHASEVKRPGDYVRRQIGAQPVLMIRDDDGGIKVLFNRCRHRGNLVCARDRGQRPDAALPLSRLDLRPLGRASGADLRGGI